MTKTLFDTLYIACPNCHAEPGEYCTQPPDIGRFSVTWFHLSREEAVDDDLDYDLIRKQRIEDAIARGDGL